MFNASNADDAPQPPKVLTTPLEIAANLKGLQESHDPLIITFEGRSQRFQSYLVAVDREKDLLVFDELIPRDGEKYLLEGEAFKVEGFHDGVRIAWDNTAPLRLSDVEGVRSYKGGLPNEIIYHQRRNAFRAALKLAQLADVKLAGDRLSKDIRGKLLDISANGCRLRFDGNITDRLQLGQVYERFWSKLPFGSFETPVELRHLHYEERLDTSFVGVRFHNLNGLLQRKIENYVFQLQREARRFDKDDF